MSHANHIENSEVMELWSHNPREQIRPFLHDVFRCLEGEIPLEWPLCDVKEYARLYRAFYDGVNEIYDAADRMRSLTPRMHMALRLMGESALYLMKHDWEHPREFHQPSAQTVELVAHRPEAILDYDQLYCPPESSQRRIERVLQWVTPASRVMFLGDDDLGSLLLSRCFEGEIFVAELDQRLLDYVHERAPDVTTLPIDLFLGGIPKSLLRTFDAVVLDPPWDHYHLWCFLYKAMICLKRSEKARIFMSFCPLYLEYMQRKKHVFERRLASWGLQIDQLTPGFHMYSLQGTEFMEMVHSFVPDIELPLLNILKNVPFGFSHLYELRWNPSAQPGALRSRLLEWWHSA